MQSTPSTMRAGVVIRSEDSFRFQIEQVPTPVPGPSDVLVRLAVTGICGTDIALATGKLGPTRRILGHEGVGYIVSVGGAVSAAEAQVGDRVGIAWLRDVCRVCAFCLHPGGETRCREQLNSGRKVDGTFAEYALVPSRYLIRIPTTINVADELIAPILCGGVTAYAAIKGASAVGGQWVAVAGAGGGVGALAVQYAKAMGYRVVALDVGSGKRDFCVASGADHYVDVGETKDLAASISQLTDGAGASVGLVCAGSGAAYNSMIDVMGPFGTLVAIGITPPDQVLSVHPLKLIDSGIKIVGSAVGTKQDILEAIGFVERGQVKPSILPRKLDDLVTIAPQFAQLAGKVVIHFDSPQRAQHL